MQNPDRFAVCGSDTAGTGADECAKGVPSLRLQFRCFAKNDAPLE